MNIFEIQGAVLLVGFVLALCVKGFAFVTALTFASEAYEASAKMTKVAWSLILGLGLVAQLVWSNPIGIFNIIFLVAALVFLADVRPALRQVTGR